MWLGGGRERERERKSKRERERERAPHVILKSTEKGRDDKDTRKELGKRATAPGLELFLSE